MKVNYTIDQKDIKDACFEAVKVLPYFKRRKIIFSLTFPFITILFPFVPLVEWWMLYIVIPFLMIYCYFYGYQDRVYTILKRTQYKNAPQLIEAALILEETKITVEQEAIKRTILRESVIASVEKEDKYILFLSQDVLDFVIIKKRPKGLTDRGIEKFNEKIKDILSI